MNAPGTSIVPDVDAVALARRIAARPCPATPDSIPLRTYADNGLADFIAASRYTRHRPELGRHESYPEAVERVSAMHRTFFRDRLGRRIDGEPTTTPADSADHALLTRMLGETTVGKAIDQAFAAVAEKRVLPSMRSLQFGGEAILRNHARLYNCAFSPADRLAFFREFFFLLLSGTGCGFSVQRHHIARLPPVPARPAEDTLPAVPHAVADSIEGWADALDVLLRGHFEGFRPAFDFSQVRPAGRPLRTSGGRAPGPGPLRRTLDEVAATLRQAAGRRLRPIEVYDLCMFVARGVLSGGIRRSACICLFSPDDAEMMNAKTGDWLEKNPQRSACNNSAVLSPATADEALFRKLFHAQQEFGEPGFYFADNPEHGCNPCGEIGLHPVLDRPLAASEIARLRSLGHAGPLPPAARLSGWQMCNLSTINAAALTCADDFLAACVHASVIGTLQAAYTDIGYLGPITRFINERDALLGVSICGFMDNPALLLDPALLTRGARLCRAVNQLVAAALGIRPAARVTCVKPEGTASLLLGSASGIHPHHARRYFRRVRAGRDDPVYRHFHASNPQMTETSVPHPESDDVITFPVAAPAGAIVRAQLGAVELLELVRHVRRHWVMPGEDPARAAAGPHHNVSHTCTVRPGEWDAVADFIWRHRDEFTGVALLAYAGGKRYPQAPLEAVETAADAERWNRLAYQSVSYRDATGTQDAPPIEDTDACAAGACEVP